MCLAVPRRVLAAEGDRFLVDVDGHPTWVRDTGLTNVQRDAYVLVYAGHAVQQISRAEAEELLAFYASLETIP